MNLQSRIEISKRTGRLCVDSMRLTTLPELPDTLVELDCSGNQLTTLPTLPKTLKKLYCHYNQLTILPTLPNYLKYLICSNNQLTTLSTLPDDLKHLSCNNNQLTSLPTLPDKLRHLDCMDNQLTTIPKLPKLRRFYFEKNKFNIIFSSIITFSCKKTFFNLKLFIRNIKEYYRTIRIQAKNTVALQLALFRVRNCDIPDHCFSLIGSYLSGEKGSLTMQVSKLRSKLN